MKYLAMIIILLGSMYSNVHADTPTIASLTLQAASITTCNVLPRVFSDATQHGCPNNLGQDIYYNICPNEIDKYHIGSGYIINIKDAHVVKIICTANQSTSIPTSSATISTSKGNVTNSQIYNNSINRNSTFHYKTFIGDRIISTSLTITNNLVYYIEKAISDIKYVYTPVILYVLGFIFVIMYLLYLLGRK